MNHSFNVHLQRQLDEIRESGSYKRERVITTPQGSMVETKGGESVINLCANNYLGLAQHEEITQAAHEALDRWGYGLGSVRFICGTQAVHLTAASSCGSTDGRCGTKPWRMSGKFAFVRSLA